MRDTTIGCILLSVVDNQRVRDTTRESLKNTTRVYERYNQGVYERYNQRVYENTTKIIQPK